VKSSENPYPDNSYRPAPISDEQTPRTYQFADWTLARGTGSEVQRRAWLKLQQAFTHALDMYDKKIDEMYRLGYSFPNTIQPDWIQLALDRREEVLAERAAERREKEAERRAEMEAEQEKEKARREYEAAKNRTIRERL
jgi:hypothetical protein